MNGDSSFALMHHDPSDLGLTCLVKKRKIRFRIYRDLRILKETHLNLSVDKLIVVRVCSNEKHVILLTV